MSAALRDLLRPERPSCPYPAVCDLCGRFVAWRDAHLSHEYGDYGTILSTVLICPKCAEWSDG